MKKKLLFLFLSATMMVSLSSCKKKVSEAEVYPQTTVQDGTVYRIDTVESQIEWKGYKVLKTDQTAHFGLLHFKTGSVTVINNRLEYGTVVADLNSMENIDLKGDSSMREKLEKHLKSADFFDIQKFPTATFEITQVTDTADGDFNAILKGNLTIKGITKPISIRANVTVNEDMVTIASEPTDFDREDFGLSFELPLENGLLNREMTLQVLIKAKRK